KSNSPAWVGTKKIWNGSISGMPLPPASPRSSCSNREKAFPITNRVEAPRADPRSRIESQSAMRDLFFGRSLYREAKLCENTSLHEGTLTLPVLGYTLPFGEALLLIPLEVPCVNACVR